MKETIDEPTRNLAEYVKDKGINIANMSRKTGLSYEVLRKSLLNDNITRNLRAYEFFIICEFLNLDPRDFVGDLSKDLNSEEA